MKRTDKKHILFTGLLLALMLYIGLAFPGLDNVSEEPEITQVSATFK